MLSLLVITIIFEKLCNTINLIYAELLSSVNKKTYRYTNTGYKSHIQIKEFFITPIVKLS